MSSLTGISLQIISRGIHKTNTVFREPKQRPLECYNLFFHLHKTLRPSICLAVPGKAWCTPPQGRNLTASITQSCISCVLEPTLSAVSCQNPLLRARRDNLGVRQRRRPAADGPGEFDRLQCHDHQSPWKPQEHRDDHHLYHHWRSVTHNQILTVCLHCVQFDRAKPGLGFNQF